MWRRAIKVGGARVDRAAKEANAGARALPIIRVLDMSSTRAPSGDRAPPTIDDRLRSQPRARRRHRLHTRNKNVRRLLLNRTRRTGCAAHRCWRHSRRTAPHLGRNALGLFAAAGHPLSVCQAALADPSVKVYWRGLLLARAARICRRGDCLRPRSEFHHRGVWLRRDSSSARGQMAGCATTICSSLPITARSATRRPFSKHF